LFSSSSGSLDDVPLVSSVPHLSAFTCRSAEAIRLASRNDLNDSYVVVVEDTIGTGVAITSTTNSRVRADMVLMPTDNGGAVFSVGTMAWLGSLSHNGYQNAVSRITRNVLDRFLVERPIS